MKCCLVIIIVMLIKVWMSAVISLESDQGRSFPPRVSCRPNPEIPEERSASAPNCSQHYGCTVKKKKKRKTRTFQLLFGCPSFIFVAHLLSDSVHQKLAEVKANIQHKLIIIFFKNRDVIAQKQTHSIHQCCYYYFYYYFTIAWKKSF